MSLCVYALTGTQAMRSAARGVNRERLRLVTVGRIAAIVGDVPRPPRMTLANVRRYDAAIRRLHVERAALLPARFGTCFAAADELVLVLQSRQQGLRDAVSQVRQRTQMTIRVVVPGGGGRTPAPGAAPAASARGSSPPAARASDRGSTYLRARAAAAAREHEIPGFDPVRAAVRRWVRAERVEKRGGVASVYHLIPRGSAGAYRIAARRAAAESGLRVVVSGPWPPYAFGTR